MISRTNEEYWHFTKAQANAMYKKAIATAKKKPIQGIPEDYMKVEVNGDWFYRVNYLSPGSQRDYIRDLWAQYGYLTYYKPKYYDGIYVRRA